ncbi:MAG TPA: chorismate-binding protein [Gemmatimonadaceae bacterium]|nr:chorismate-binding protein [Gemmatimonadaceae bacterium]
MSFDAFMDRARAHGAGALVPVWRDCLLDSDTAVSAFHRLRQQPFAFLLESAPAGGETWARYTFLGTAPRAAWRLVDDRVEDWTPALGWHGARTPADPFADLQAILDAHPPAEVPELGAFWGGAVGYFSYDAVRHIERLENPPPRTTDAPDALFLLTGAVVIVDNLRAQARVVVGVVVPDLPDEAACRRAWDDAQREMDETILRLRTGPALPPLELDPGAAPAEGMSNYGREKFMADVMRIKEHIVAGDIFQGLIARRISVPRDFDGTSLYRAIRVLNPSPYMFHLVLGEMELVGSSPELLVRVADGKVVVRPIAGTRPRAATAAEDDARSAELLADEKERAEHIMLVDLGRNDVGRVAEYGSVEVTELMKVERYSHVLHIVSQVEGRLRGGLSAIDVFKATFPAGTMTGAPKVRAMEIIDELEPERRGPYAGALGYIAWGDRRMDLAITIRTCMLTGDTASVQAGAGIVADSDPASEWAETENKARAMLTAIGRVRAATVA